MFKKIILGALLSVLIMGQLSFSSEASSTFSSTYNQIQPDANSNSGWVCLLLRNNSTGAYTTRLYSFTVITVNDEGAYSAGIPYINITPRYLEVGPYGNLSNSGTAFFSCLFHDKGGGTKVVKNSSSERAHIDIDSGYIIYDYKLYGSTVVNSSSVPSVEVNWNVYFQSGDSANKYVQQLYDLINNLVIGGDTGLNSIYDVLHDMYYSLENSQSLLDWSYEELCFLSESVDEIEGYLNSMASTLNIAVQELDAIYYKLDSCEELLSDILEEEKKQTSLREKILNYVNESADKQKQEAQNQGSSSVSQGTASIEDKGAGFANSIGGLVSSMSYNGTQCAWTFPEVRLPAIAGVMEERVLIEEQPIDFSVWINAIPAPILLLIQSLLTMGLIVYCFKELYGTISYVLTLRGGGSNE